MFLKNMCMAIDIVWPSFTSKWFTIQKIYSKVYSTSYSNTHHNITMVVTDGMVWNIKKSVSQGRNEIFPWNWKIFKLLIKDNIFKGYRFLTKVTLKLCYIHFLCDMLNVCFPGVLEGHLPLNENEFSYCTS